MMKDFLAITKALSDENRIRAVMALRGGELCVCQIIELLRLAPSTVSKHMAILYQAGLIKSRKEGRWIYYRLAEDVEWPCIRQVLDVVFDCLKKDTLIRDDSKKLKSIRKMSKDKLCIHYHN